MRLHMTFSMRMEYLFGKCVSTVVYVKKEYYRIKVYATQMCAYVFYAHFQNLCASWHFHPAFFYAIIQNVHKNRWMKTQLDLQRYIRATSVRTTCFIQALYRMNHYTGFTLLNVVDTN